MVGKGFYDKENWLKDEKVSTGGLELFRKWFVQRKLDTPITNVWEFNIGKLIVLGFLFDDDLLVDMLKKYDPITRVVKNHVGDNLFRVSLDLIREVFKLNPNHVHEKIGIEDLQARYDAQRMYLRGGSLQQNFVKLDHCPWVDKIPPSP